MTNCLFWVFGDDDDLNEALLQASDKFESKITSQRCATAPSLALAPSRAPSTTSATCRQPSLLPELPGHKLHP